MSSRLPTKRSSRSASSRMVESRSAVCCASYKIACRTAATWMRRGSRRAACADRATANSASRRAACRLPHGPALRPRVRRVQSARSRARSGRAANRAGAARRARSSARSSWLLQADHAHQPLPRAHRQKQAFGARKRFGVAAGCGCPSPSTTSPQPSPARRVRPPADSRRGSQDAWSSDRAAGSRHWIFSIEAI